MNLHGIVARSGQAFKYILDPTVDLISPSQAARFAEARRQLAEAQRKLDESERASREKDGLIAQLREELGAKAEQVQPALPQEAKPSHKRKVAKKTRPQAKPTQTHRKAKPTTLQAKAGDKSRSRRIGNGPKA